MEIIKYMRDEKGAPFGVIVAKRIGDEVNIAGSLCNKKDRFCKKIGKTIASGRAENASHKYVDNIPQTLLSGVFSMAERAQKYFKGCIINLPIETNNSRCPSH